MERKKLHKDFAPKFCMIINLVESKLDDVKKLFDEQKNLKETRNELVVQKNMPRVAGTINWCNELKVRAKKPIHYFKKLMKSNTFEVEFEQKYRIEKKYCELLDLLDTFSEQIYKDWCVHVGELSNDNLEKKLIIRDLKTKEIHTNFDPQVC